MLPVIDPPRGRPVGSGGVHRKKLSELKILKLHLFNAIFKGKHSETLTLFLVMQECPHRFSIPIMGY